MMGSKLSFVVLCVINAFVVDNAIGNLDESGREVGWVPKLINGDDSAFRGGDKEFHLWETYASWVGLRVNIEKTGRSDRFVEINSRCYDCKRGKLVPKPSFGFLATKGIRDDWVDDPWDALMRTIRELRSTSARFHLLSCWHVRQVLEKSGPPNLLNIPSRFRRWFYKRKWFRRLSNSTWDSGTVERELPCVIGPLPITEKARECVEDMESWARSVHKLRWNGKPPSSKPCGHVDYRLMHREKRGWCPMRVTRGDIQATRVWVRSVLEFVKDKIPLADLTYRRQRDIDPELLRINPDTRFVAKPVTSRNTPVEFSPLLGKRWEMCTRCAAVSRHSLHTGGKCPVRSKSLIPRASVGASLVTAEEEDDYRDTMPSRVYFGFH